MRFVVLFNESPARGNASRAQRQHEEDVRPYHFAGLLIAFSGTLFSALMFSIRQAALKLSWLWFVREIAAPDSAIDTMSPACDAAASDRRAESSPLPSAAMEA